MANRLTLVFLLILILFLVSGVNSCIQKAITCDKPYLKVGLECCLDQNDNAICDNDEQTNQQENLSNIEENYSDFQESGVEQSKKQEIGIPIETYLISYPVNEKISLTINEVAVTDIIKSKTFGGSSWNTEQVHTSSEGNKFYVIDLTIKNMHNNAVLTSCSGFRLKDKKGYVYDLIEITLPYFNQLLPEEIIRGTVAFEIPEDLTLSDLHFCWDEVQPKIFLQLT